MKITGSPNRFRLPKGFLLIVFKEIIQVWRAVKILNPITDTSYHYILSRDIDDFKVQWLKVDVDLLDLETQKIINSIIRNMAFL